MTTLYLWWLCMMIVAAASWYIGRINLERFQRLEKQMAEFEEELKGKKRKGLAV
jgi:hypothetical protein